ncbi:glycosyltransferase [Paramylibacter kogurei]|uniref:glycosyltransferase family 2 protein n=1 Tax=Paramylibacter kogurei TaxID=1889778 RepID=UPI001F0B3CFD|nr:cellulose synthase catalytic subunit [Amylibacter kogurei]
MWQITAVAAVTLGGWYLFWRWTESLNYDALWFAIPVVCAESCAFLGMVLFFNNLWSMRDVAPQSAPITLSEVIVDGGDQPISVDIFIPTYTEDPELTRYSIQDAKKITYPYAIDINIYVLDDGNRARMRKIAAQENVHYITRESNIGYKAGNLRNALEHSSGDFVVILDSDTRPFPTILENTLGYFKDKDVAWVQTPQWFYDVPEGITLDIYLEQRIGLIGKSVGRFVQIFLGPVSIGKDPFVSDPKLFYDVILRRRNRANASFCCGAGSIHRRDAVMEAALKAYATQIQQTVTAYSCNETDHSISNTLKREFSVSTEITPYKFHVSEDIYTSIILQSDTERNWKSVLHPHVESKMLSPLDMHSWAMQRYKYAGGTLDILRNDNPLFRSGMTFQQKLMYAMTFWSYLAPLWNCIFIAAPLMALFTGISPISSYSKEFFLHLIPFLVMHECASAFGTWGIDNRKGRTLNLAFFSFNLRAIWAVLCGREIQFHVTPKQRRSGNFLYLVWPQICVVVLTIIAMFWAITLQVISPDPRQTAALVVNGFWAATNAYAMTVLIGAALWKPSNDSLIRIDVKNRRWFRRA